MPDAGPGNDFPVYEFTLGELDADERIDQVLAALCPTSRGRTSST